MSKFKKVCTKCIDANDNIPISAEFEVQVIFGTCDCCKEKGLLVPFELFFNKMVDLKPYRELKKTANVKGKELDIGKLSEELDKIQKPKTKWQEEIEKSIEELNEKLKEADSKKMLD
jgi:hypothetical protein